MYSGLEMKRQC